MPAAGPLDPDRLAATEFSTSFRGFDAGEVRSLLLTVSEALRESAAREQDLRERLARAERRVRELDESATARTEAAAEEARREGREMVAEAQRVRERMLGDLARRRRHARQQVEQLMAGRERLLEAFDNVRQTIDTATNEMRTALPEARLAAEAAGRRFDQGDAEEGEAAEVAALEGEIEAARLAGLPIVEAELGTVDAGGPAAGDAGEGPTAAGGPEPSLLGERDVREMAPVELGAAFEDVRIVPVDQPDATASAAAEAPVAVESVREPEAAPSPSSGPEAQALPDDDEAEPEDEDEDDDEPEDEDEPEAGPEPEAPPPVDAGVVSDEREPVDADVVSDEPAPVDAGHLDDLFAGLRAARAEAVNDARAVLARDVAAAAPAPASEATAPAAADPAPAPEFAAADDDDATDPAVDAPAADPSPAGPLAAVRSDAGTRDEPGVPAPAPLDVDGALLTTAEALASALKRVLGDEQNELLERLRTLRRGAAADAPEVLGDAGELTQRFAAVAAGPLGDLADRAMASLAPDHRARPPAPGPMATAVATELVAPLHERLARGFAESGTDAAEASVRARATFREWKTQRIGALAADAARSAYHAGLLAGVAKGRALAWAPEDDDACPECGDNALAGPVARGARYPTGHRHPPAHDGCRCVLRPAETHD